jgi:hypothetical protein
MSLVLVALVQRVFANPVGNQTRLILFKPGGVDLLEAAVVAEGLQPAIDKSRKGGVALQPVRSIN